MNYSDIEKVANEIRKLGPEMCYVTSQKFIDSFPGTLRQGGFDSFDEFIYSIRPNEEAIYNVEIHLTVELPDEEKEAFIKGIPLRGMMKHVTNKPKKLRLFTHAFNIVVLKDEFRIYQSWGRAHVYRLVEANAIEMLPRFLNNINRGLKGILNDPTAIFIACGLSYREFNRMCHFEAYNTLMKRLHERNVQTSLVILSDKKHI